MKFLDKVLGQKRMQACIYLINEKNLTFSNTFNQAPAVRNNVCVPCDSSAKSSSICSFFSASQWDIVTFIGLGVNCPGNCSNSILAPPPNITPPLGTDSRLLL